MGAEFTIEGTAFDTLGYDATHSQVLDLALEDSIGLDAPRVVFSVVAKSDGAPALTFSPSTGIPTTPTGTVTVTMPGSGVHSYRIQCQVNEGRDSTGRTNREYTKERIVAIRSENLELRKLVPGETTQYSATGWTEEQNSAVDALDDVGGGSGTTEDVEATADTLALRGPAAELKSSRIETPIVRTATSGDVTFQHGSTAFARLRSTDAPAQIGDIGFRENGRMLVYALERDSGTADAYDFALLNDVQLRGGVNKPQDSGAMSTYWAVLASSIAKPVEIAFVNIISPVNISSNATDYATIEVLAITGIGESPVLIASTTTQSGIGEISPISIELSNTTINFGYIYVVISKSGAGVQLPAMYICFGANPITTYAGP